MLPVICVIAALALLAVLAPAFCGMRDLHFHTRVRPGQVRVACAGDSITNGALIPGCFFRAYPAVLGRLLGKGYHVENFGLNGRTLSDEADRPYSAEAEFRRCIDYCPDLVILMLGTNDTKPANWRGAEDLAPRFDAMLARFAAPEHRPRLILCTPTWAVNAQNRIQYITNDTEAALLPEVARCAREAAERHGLELADLYALFEGRRDLISYDGIHPNARGARAIAAELAKRIV